MRADVVAKRGRSYVAYCIATDAQRRREINSSTALLGDDGSNAENNNNNGGGADGSAGAAIAAGGSNGASAAGAAVGSPTSGPAGHQTAAQRELNLGLILSINPAIEVMLDSGDATMHKDLYNSGTFLPVSNLSNVANAMGTPHLSSSHHQQQNQQFGSGLLIGSAGANRSTHQHFGGGGGGSDCPSGAGFSLTRRATLGGGGSGNCGGVGSLASGGGLGGGNGNGNGGLGESSGSLRNPSTLLRFSPQTRSTPPTTAIENPRVGSVAKTTLVYNVAEAEVALAASAGWRIGIMTNQPSNVVMAHLYDALADLDMCWKVLSPYRVAAKVNDPPRSALGQRRRDAMLEATRLNAEAVKAAESSAFEQQQAARFQQQQQQQQRGFPQQHQLLAGPSPSAASSPLTIASPTGGCGGVVGASLSVRPVAITLHLFRLQEKHDKGYIIDFGVRGGEQPMVAMDIINEIYEALRQRIG